MTEIDLQPPDEESRRLWSSVADLVDVLPADWVLVGGLMVQLYALEANGFTAKLPDFDGYAFRYLRGELIVDVLAPDGMRPPPELGPGRIAIGVPGGTQALARQEPVTVRLGDRTSIIRRPTLLGAILIKARSLIVHHDPDAQREDLLLLLSLVEDPRAMADELKRSERRWLRDAAERLDLDRPANVGAERIRLARLALRLLTREA